jgi:hypothetical protein
MICNLLHSWIVSVRLAQGTRQVQRPSTEVNLRMALPSYLSLSASYRKRQVGQWSGPHVPHRPKRWQLHADRLRPFHSNSFSFNPLTTLPASALYPTKNDNSERPISHFLPQIRFVTMLPLLRASGRLPVGDSASCRDYGADSDVGGGHSARFLASSVPFTDYS